MSDVNNNSPEVRVNKATDPAYVLASSNRHKSWARRWLKENGHWSFTAKEMERRHGRK